jgi:hypothetical protein
MNMLINEGKIQIDERETRPEHKEKVKERSFEFLVAS